MLGGFVVPAPPNPYTSESTHHARPSRARRPGNSAVARDLYGLDAGPHPAAALGPPVFTFLRNEGGGGEFEMEPLFTARPVSDCFQNVLRTWSTGLLAQEKWAPAKGRHTLLAPPRST